MTAEFVSFQSGRYQVLRKLGEGGKGIVFLCQDKALSRNVAVKVIKEEVLDPEGLLRFQREVQAMGQLMHPNVVAVFDIGQEAGKHFVVLELMDGGDVEHLIESSSNKRLDAATTVRIGKEVAKALEHAHKPGILHRDIKPANIWLTKDGQAKLGDFGLAYLGGSLRITQAGMMVGSVAYMAPEVALGRQADARSDLYMFGATLYEMVTGRVPFSGDDPVKVIFSHINDLPLSPRRFAPEVPEGLESLIFKLLSKDPEQRPKAAADVLSALGEIEREVKGAPASVGVAVQGQPSASRPPSPEPRFAQPLVGRDREIGLLKQRVDAALRGEGSLVFITGEAGIGKTRLALEVRPYARGRSFLWLEGRYLKEGTIPFQPWVEAIQTFLRVAPPALQLKVLMPYAAELVKLVPEVAECLGHVPPAPSIGPEEERTRLIQAMNGFFTAIAREQPLVFFLDDLQWASSLDALHHLVRNASSERLVVIGAYRDAELKESQSLSKAILGLNRERLFQPLPLKRLGQEEVARMIGQTLGQAASEKLTEIVYEKTEGNPFFVEELLRYLAESGEVTLGEKGWEVKNLSLVQLPDSVKAVVEERLEGLGEEAKGVLAWASVIGREFLLPLIKEVSGLDEDRLLEVIDRAVEARVLSPRPSLGQEAYAFVDNQVRDVLYEGIGPARRRRYHLKAGQAIEKVCAKRLEEHYDALARHFLEGNDLQKAAEYSNKAGDRASVIYAWERAMAHYQTVIELREELGPNPTHQAELLEKLASVTALGQGKGALVLYEKALVLYEALADRKKAGAVHLRLAEQYGFNEMGGHDFKKAYAHGIKAVEILEPEGDSPSLAWAYARLGFNAVFSGAEPTAAAITRVEKGLAVAERLNDFPAMAEARGVLGRLYHRAGEIGKGFESSEKSYELARINGDLVTLAQRAGSLSFSYATVADGASAFRWAEEASRAAKQAGALRHQIFSSSLLSQASILLGEVSGALSHLETAQQLARSAGMDITRIRGFQTRILPALLSFYLGDWDKALQSLGVNPAEKELAESWTTVTQMQAELMLASQLYLELGEIAKAKECVRECVTLFEAKGDQMQELWARVFLAEAAGRGGDLEEAEVELQRAKKIVSNGEDWRGLAAEVYQAEGIVRGGQKRWQEAETAFQKALEINRQYQIPYYEARTLFEWGQMYLARSGSDDRARGMKLLDQALAMFQRIQAKKMVEKVLSRKQLLTA